jgi:hypothetical protein
MPALGCLQVGFVGDLLLSDEAAEEHVRQYISQTLQCQGAVVNLGTLTAEELQPSFLACEPQSADTM